MSEKAEEVTGWKLDLKKRRKTKKRSGCFGYFGAKEIMKAEDRSEHFRDVYVC